MGHKTTGRRALTALSLAAVVVLAGCDRLDTWMGENEPPPLPGERITIMDIDKSITADPEVAGQQIQLPEPLAGTNWLQVGGNAQHLMGHLYVSDNPQQVWRASVGDGKSSDSRILGQPLIVDGVVYSMDARSQVSAFSLSNGNLIWRQDLESDEEDDGYFGGGIAYDQGRIFVSTGFLRAFALRADSGEVIWDTAVSGPVRGAPTVSDNKVMLVTLDNKLEVLDAENGGQAYSHTGIQETAGLVGGASAASNGSVTLVPYTSGEIVALLTDNGRELWNDSLSAIRRGAQAEDIAHIRALPVLDDRVAYAISHSGRMAAIDLRRGLRIWEAEIGGVEMPWIAGDYIYVVTQEGEVVCLLRSSGQVVWVTKLPRYEDPEDRDGVINWKGPVLVGDRLIVASSLGEARTLSPYTGEEISKIDLPGGVAVSPVVGNDVVVFLTEDGDLVVYR
ncbi:outer membrane protein assembly factor BamB family protein [Rhodovibrionaceae bacterium A322]